MVSNEILGSDPGQHKEIIKVEVCGEEPLGTDPTGLTETELAELVNQINSLAGVVHRGTYGRGFRRTGRHS